MNLDKLKVGRKLNILIAKNVMGWTHWENCNDGDWEGPDDVTFFANFSGEFGLAVYEPGYDEPTFYFAPSTDLQDAWDVVEKMKDKSWLITIQNCHDKTGHNYQWCVIMANNDPESEAVEGMASTVPLAICLAALKAVGYK